jgi:CheY-like chemotaxis protein
VVDEEEALARLVQTTLGSLGYEVEASTRPVEALALVTSDPDRFALVLTDQTMPGMSGLQLADRLRQLRPGLPILLMSGYAAPLNPARLESAGVSRLLVKPCTIRSLGTAVHAALAAQHAPEPLLEPVPVH